MQEYVVGFLFSEDKDFVVLIQKNRPDWMKGKLNGIGGKVEANEWPLAAMIREFKEETGVAFDKWELFTTVGAKTNPRDGKGAWKIYYYRAFSTKDLYEVESKTDEHVDIYNVGLLYKLPTVYHLSWTIPMALNSTSVYDMTERIEQER